MFCAVTETVRLNLMEMKRHGVLLERERHAKMSHSFARSSLHRRSRFAACSKRGDAHVIIIAIKYA